MSHIYLFFCGQSGDASRWRVCYQRGLPRLVYVQQQTILDICHKAGDVLPGHLPKDHNPAWAGIRQCSLLTTVPMVNCPTFLPAAPSPCPQPSPSSSAGLAATGLAALGTGHHCIEECNKLVAREAQRRPSVARNVLLGEVAMMAIPLIPGQREGDEVSAIGNSLLYRASIGFAFFKLKPKHWLPR